PDDRAREQAMLSRLLVGEVPSYRCEKRYLRQDGSPVWVRVTSSLAAAGTPHAYRISIIEDVEERKRTEQELRDSEARFRSTFEQAAVGMGHLALDGRWLRVNDRLCA